MLSNERRVDVMFRKNKKDTNINQKLIRQYEEINEIVAKQRKDSERLVELLEELQHNCLKNIGSL